MNFVSLNDSKPSKKTVPFSSYLTIFGDFLRLVCLYYLVMYILYKKPSSLKMFLIIYAISSVFIGFFAYTHGHFLRGFSEYIFAIVFLYLYMIY